jgi:hypothetical protein
MRVGDLLGPASDHMESGFVANLSNEKVLELASSTTIVAVKPDAD